MGAFDIFGVSVAISGDTIVVGASGEDSYTGSAYVFVKPTDGWSNMTKTAKLSASDGAMFDWFGHSVTISGDTIVVGAFEDDSAYVFVKPTGGWSNMTQTAKLTAGVAGYNFGISVAISGDTIVIGAEKVGLYRGSAYVFVKPTGGWSNMTHTAELIASDCARYDSFGISVAISGDIIVVGASGDNITYTDQGSAYVFQKSFPVYLPLVVRSR